MYRSPSQKMMSQVQISKDGTALPEVVPVENLRHNTIRHEDSWYRNQHADSHSHGQPQFYDANSVKSPYSPHPNSSHSAYLHPAESVTGNSWHESISAALPSRLQTSNPSRSRNFLLFAIPTFIITAIIMGAALGYPLAEANRKLNPNNYKPLASTQVDTINISKYCDANGKAVGSSYFGTNGTSSFDIYCAKVFQGSLPALNPNPSATNKVQGTLWNIGTIISYNFEDCMYACASLNNLTQNPNPVSPTCQSVTFVALMGMAVTGYGGNCFLKNSTVADLSTAAVQPYTVSAELRGLRN